MARQAQFSLDEVLVHFSQLEDPRSEVNRKHPLASVIVIAIMGVLAGARGPTGIAQWAAYKKEFLEKWLPLPHGVPAKDVFRRVLMSLKPEVFQVCFANWLATIQQAAAESTGVDGRILSIDGKTLRRSHDRRNGLGALHSVSVWCSELGLTLAQVATEEKSNEITAIPEVLRLVDLKGAIITIDALGTQKAIARQIREGEGDYVLALKDNQPGLTASVRAYAEHHAKKGFRDIPAQCHVTEEKGHGRRERREYVQFPVADDLPGQDNWSGLTTLGRVTLTCIRNGQETSETRCYISSLPLDVERFSRAVRSHWSIENTCHWSLDVTYREDESRIRERHLTENFAWLYRFTLSLLQQHPRKTSLAMKRSGCGWNEHFLLEVLTQQTT